MNLKQSEKNSRKFSIKQLTNALKIITEDVHSHLELAYDILASLRWKPLWSSVECLSKLFLMPLADLQWL